MLRVLFKDFDLVVTMDEKFGNIKGGYVLVEDNIIKYVGSVEPEVESVDRVIDGRGKVLLPGFVNTHHHLYQSLTRSIGAVSGAKLFDWLRFLYGVWRNIDEEAVYVSAVVSIAEMMLSGVTTTTDHLYLVPEDNEAIFDAEIGAARLLGVRFHPTRGSMSLSVEDGGLPPRSVVQREDRILEHTVSLIQKYHDASKYSMLRIAVAPCSPFSVTETLMKESIKIADEYGVLLHTHLAETVDEDNYCMDRFGVRPVDYMQRLGWLREDVWFAHLVQLNEADIVKLSDAKVGMAHCPSSNMRLGSGIAPVVKMKDTGVKIGIAVDGSASNDTNNFIMEMRNALLLQRVKYGADSLMPEDVLKMGTVGGASVLHMDDYIGSISPQKAADIVAVRVDDIYHAGGQDDLVASVLLCDTKGVEFSMINGKIVIEGGALLDVDLESFIRKHNQISKKLSSR